MKNKVYAVNKVSELSEVDAMSGEDYLQELNNAIKEQEMMLRKMDLLRNKQAYQAARIASMVSILANVWK